MSKNIFISHASEDKETIVSPFAKELEKYGITYWLDMKEIVPGDHLLGKIFKEGISNSDYVVVFISKNFLAKGWTNAELQNALSKQFRTNKNIVIPFLVDITFAELLSKYPEFENIFCGDIRNGISTAAFQLSKIVNGKILTNESYLKRHELLSIINWYKEEFIDRLYKMSYDDIFEVYTPKLVEVIYAFIFSYYTEKQQKQFVLDRLNTHILDPTESFFQISLALNSNWLEKNSIVNRILKQYPFPQKEDFLTTVLPSKEVSFFQKISAGIFTFGANEKDNYKKDWIAKSVDIYLDDYNISTTPITNQIYELFFPEHCTKRISTYTDLSQHPVVNVNWYEANMFTVWLSQTINMVSLPTEFEWEKAASWSPQNVKRIFPWGNKWKKNCCNSWYDGKKEGTTRVGFYETGKSAYDLYDMSGNVWEWCSDWFSDDWTKFFSNKIASNPTGPLIGNRKVNRGGGWYKDVGMPTVYMRAGDSLMDRFMHCGFRIVKKEKKYE